MLLYGVSCMHPNFSRFGPIHPCDRRTDGRAVDAYSALCIYAAVCWNLLQTDLRCHGNKNFGITEY